MRHLPLLLCALLSAVVKLLLPLLTGSLSVQEFFQHWFAASKQCQDGQLFGSVLRDSQIDCLDVSAHSSEAAATEHSQRKQPEGERGGRGGTDIYIERSIQGCCVRQAKMDPTHHLAIFDETIRIKMDSLLEAATL